MYAFADLSYCVICVALAIALVTSSGGATFAEMSISPSGEQRVIGRKLGILPTLKGHMARLGTLMNVLFRDVDDIERHTIVLKAIAEMKMLLDAVGQKFVPTKVAALSNVDEKSDALSGFQICIQGAVGVLQEMADQVKGNKFADARNSLLGLDELRRDCHTQYAGD